MDSITILGVVAGGRIVGLGVITTGFGVVTTTLGGKVNGVSGVGYLYPSNFVVAWGVGLGVTWNFGNRKSGSWD